MEVFYWNQINSSLNFFNKKQSGISIGSFDGLHQGHRTLINKLVSECKSKNLNSGIITFTRPLPSIKKSSDYEGDLSTLNQRLQNFEQNGIDFVIVVDFTPEFASFSGFDFLTQLIDLFHLKYLVEGIDFRCGYKGATDSKMIKTFCEDHNISVDFVAPVFYMDNEIQESRISSSLIRKFVIKGIFTTVNGMLTRSYALDLSDFNGLIIDKNAINQAVPESGLFICKNEKNHEIKVEINNNQIILSEPSKTVFFI